MSSGHQCHSPRSRQRAASCCEPKSEFELVPEGRFFAHIVCGAAVQLCSCTAPNFHTQIPSPHVSGDCEVPRDRLPARLCPPPDRVGSRCPATTFIHTAAAPRIANCRQIDSLSGIIRRALASCRHGQEEQRQGAGRIR